MVVKMMRWSAWTPSSGAGTRKFQVKVRRMKLEGYDCGNEEGNKVMAIKMKWKGEPKFGLVVPFSSSKQRRDISKERVLKKGQHIEWEDEFENICSFSAVSNDENSKFGPWDASFYVLYGEMNAKMAVIGRASLNIAEMASTKQPQIETKLPINLQVAGVAKEATFLVSVSFVEIRDAQGSAGLLRKSTESTVVKGSMGVGSDDKKKTERKKQLSQELNLDQSDASLDVENGLETISAIGSGQSSGTDTQLDPVNKVGFFSWKRRRLSIRPARRTAEPLIKENNTENDVSKTDVGSNPAGSSSLDSISCSSTKVDATAPVNQDDQTCTTGNWETREIVSRDEQTKVKTDVFFASFDQCGDKAVGESACAALVTVIAHWLQSNQQAMPTRSELDSLILQGSSEWRRLCENEAYVNEFPDRHFDLETVLRAHLRPLSVLQEKSFVGFFDPEKFESLKGAMSFDEIWNKIIDSNNEEDEPRVYIVSWNDHFFVLKAEADAYYMIDTLGERLFEGCNQAYILKFDDSTLMHGKTQKARTGEETTSGADAIDAKEEETEEIICSGKECCREFIKRFLAAIPLRELEAQEKKETVSSYSLHQRLQIEFNFSLSSPLSSPFSSSSTSISSLF